MSLQDYNLTISRVASGFYTVTNTHENLEWELMTVERLLNGIKEGVGYDELKEEIAAENLKPKQWILMNAYSGYTLQDGISIYKTKAECIGHIEFVNED